MKRSLVVSVMESPTRRIAGLLAILGAVAVAASSALAGVARMSWNGCYPDSARTYLRSYCNSNAGEQRLFGSFILDQPMADFVGMEVVVDVTTDALGLHQPPGPPLPAWWQFFETGTCRRMAMSVSFDFSQLSGSCADPFQGEPGQGGVAAYCRLGSNCVDAPYSLSGARIKAAGAIALPVGIAAGAEHYGFVIRITNEKTVGTDACAGCCQGVVLRLNDIKAAGLSGSVEHCQGSYWDGFAVWQSDDSSVNPACGATPAHAPTWGQIKSLYR